MPNDDAVGKGGGGVKMSLKVMASYLYVPLLCVFYETVLKQYFGLD